MWRIAIVVLYMGLGALLAHLGLPFTKAGFWVINAVVLFISAVSYICGWKRL